MASKYQAPRGTFDVLPPEALARARVETAANGIFARAGYGRIATPGYAPGHVTYSVRGEDAIFSGDVLFQSSVGRVDLPGGDGPTLLRSIQTLLDSHPEETDVYPGHMGPTTLGAERATNPFLTELSS